MRLKKLLLATSLIFCFHIQYAQLDVATAYINSNNVRAVINSNGALFWDFEDGQFITNPLEGNDLGTLRSSGLWITGLDPGANLKGAIQTYNEDDKTDFIPGALHSGTLDLIDLNKIWHISKEDIETHIADFEDNNIIDDPNANVFSWPARGNPFFFDYNEGMGLPNTNQGLAPFWDENLDGLYDPTDGDYPVVNVRGCDGVAIVPGNLWWFVYNDNTLHTESQMVPMRMEIQTSLFTYTCEEDSPLNNTIFVQHKLINRGTEDLESTTFGTYLDFDIGNPNDDFFGTDTTRSVVYGYNGDDEDENGYGSDIPVMSVDFIRGPFSFQNGQTQELGLSRVMPVPENTSFNAIEYHRLLNGEFIDGTPAPNNGLFYPGNPNDPNGWSEVTEGNSPGERRVVAAAGSFTLFPGAINELILAYTFHQKSGNTPLETIDEMTSDIDIVQALFDNCFDIGTTNCTETVDVNEVFQVPGKVFPNPTNQEIKISLDSYRMQEIQLIDVTGKLVFQQKFNIPTVETTLNIDTVADGIYFLIAKTDVGAAFKEKIVILP